MRKFFAFLLLIISTQLSAQILEPAKWEIEVSQPNANLGQEIDLIFNVKIDEGWYLYSTDFDPELGPMVTEFVFQPHASYKLLGDIVPINPKKAYDELWEGEYTYFKKTAQFRQTILLQANQPTIQGIYYYQVCTDIDGKCISFDDEYSFGELLGSKPETTTSEETPAVSVANKEDNQSPQPKPSTQGLFGFMIAAFLAGLAAIFTPCVFPMIPMTVTFFTGRGGKGKRQALLYAFFIILIYTLIGSVLAPFMGPTTANELATGWVSNVIFFTVFILFSLSFLGMFEITLPSSFVNKMDQQSDKGGFTGVFFMAFTLVLVSFSCTGPLVGTILVESAGGQVLKPIMGMFAFSLAFALPFGTFALFPNLLANLPKSGGWLNSVKVVLGFLELALAFKFLSIADQAYHWHILDREIYLAIWIVIFSLLGLYLLGKINLPHDTPSKKTSISGLLLAILTFSFVVYLIPGMWGAPLKALSGYLPPLTTQDFQVSPPSSTSTKSTICETPKYGDDLHLPHGIQGYFDYDQALACAKNQNKPVFIDFTGHGCVNCREMEARVWSDPKVLKRMKEDFVILALYVDDKQELPKSDWVTSTYDGKMKMTMGKVNADFQITRFNNNAQPYYVILDSNGELLLTPKAYDLDIGNFVQYLEDGKKAFKKKDK